MKPLKAAIRSENELDVGLVSVVLAAGPVDCVTAICAMFFAKRSLSPLSSLSRLFMAPGLDFILFLLMIFTWSVGFSSVVALVGASSSSGKASARASRVVTSFLFGRLRFGALVEDFVTLFIRFACLMRLLSSFVCEKRDSELSLCGAYGFLRIDLRGA